MFSHREDAEYCEQLLRSSDVRRRMSHSVFQGEGGESVDHSQDFRFSLVWVANITAPFGKATYIELPFCWMFEGDVWGAA